MLHFVWGHLSRKQTVVQAAKKLQSFQKCWKLSYYSQPKRCQHFWSDLRPFLQTNIIRKWVTWDIFWMFSCKGSSFSGKRLPLTYRDYFYAILTEVLKNYITLENYSWEFLLNPLCTSFTLSSIILRQNLYSLTAFCTINWQLGALYLGTRYTIHARLLSVTPLL